MCGSGTTLRQQGIKILAYLDDWLICARSKEIADLHTVLMHLNARVFIVNQKKSLLTPTQSIMFLGLNLNSVSCLAVMFLGLNLNSVSYQATLSES